MIDVGYSGRDRRRSHLARPEPVRALPDRGQPPEVRAGRLVRRGARPDPDERPLREREPAGRHLRAGLVHRLPARATGSSAGAASGTRCRRCTSRRCSSTGSPCSGSALVGRRLGGPRLGATLAFAWAAWPFTQYASNSNTNDAIMPAFLIWGFFALTSPAVRGVSVALSGWTKFASLLVVPLWSGYPEAAARRATPCASCSGSRSRRRSCSSCSSSSRRRCMRRASSSIARSASRSGATRRSRSGTGASTTPGASRA